MVEKRSQTGLRIERRKVGSTEKELLGTIPLKRGKFPMLGLDMLITVYKFNENKGTRKVLIEGQTLRTKNSRDRRVVRLPQRSGAIVKQEDGNGNEILFKQFRMDAQETALKGGELYE